MLASAACTPSRGAEMDASPSPPMEVPASPATQTERKERFLLAAAQRDAAMSPEERTRQRAAAAAEVPSPPPTVKAPASPATLAMLRKQRKEQRHAAMTTEERTRQRAVEAADEGDRESERVRSRWQTAVVAMRAEMTRLREDLSSTDAEAVGVLEGMLDDAAECAVGYASALEQLRRQRDDALRRAELAEAQAAAEKQRADRVSAVLAGLSGLRPKLRKMVAAIPGTFQTTGSEKSGKAKGRRRRAD